MGELIVAFKDNQHLPISLTMSDVQALEFLNSLKTIRNLPLSEQPNWVMVSYTNHLEQTSFMLFDLSSMLFANFLPDDEE